MLKINNILIYIILLYFNIKINPRFRLSINYLKNECTAIIFKLEFSIPYKLLFYLNTP